MWEWLVGEAGAGWIIGIIGILLTVYSFRNREKPPRIVVEDPFMDGGVSIADRQTRQATFKDYEIGPDEAKLLTDVNRLSSKYIKVFNEGRADIGQPVKFRLYFASRHRNETYKGIARLRVLDTGFVGFPLVPTNPQERTSFMVELPFVNSRERHDHVWIVHIISEDPIAIFSVEGQGAGWSTRYIAKKR